MEMAAFNLKDTLFVTWHAQNGIERTRVWRVKYNAAYFESFANDLCVLFRAKREDGSRGTEWPTFKEAFFSFKRMFSSVKVWRPYVHPFFEPRKYSLTKPYVPMT